MMRLKSTKVRGDISLRCYDHDRHGTIETLSRGSLVIVRPVFGLLKPAKQQRRQNPRFRAKPKAKRSRPLGRMRANRSERVVAPDKKQVIRRDASTGSP